MGEDAGGRELQGSAGKHEETWRMTGTGWHQRCTPSFLLYGPALWAQHRKQQRRLQTPAQGTVNQKAYGITEGRKNYHLSNLDRPKEKNPTDWEDPRGLEVLEVM
ncbi:uncharacterized protein PGTG_21240 [Puccinia graminis f. sp. tritici CRL 75-36-700-3]|uniref:Uncharacterized protein n=1 Tax=Puccinia graminis f. sp. tritici (strain CRL 75-36-700-3 / race SCCL) TaxID=418459 RepID=H6QQT8_PUCGT|nr:uncharacterized protein PGTG_21240 [Puccinia graminis f. sp. tritici CRL 75-36-700-3]EHS62867.1 hypothetical protein PGTG_21240 [Puccinia graminis f. sp. tritici CRL 75-36-700-3]